MERRQKRILTDFAVVLIITAAAIAAIINFKDYVNKSEAMQAMKQLSQIILKYKKQTGAVPPEAYIDDIMENIEGKVRLGRLYYRARWIDFGVKPDTILAYVKKEYPSSILPDGYIVLRLDGTVEWMEPGKSEELLAEQQTPFELELLKK